MLDPRQLYTLNEDVTAKLKEHRPVLIHQLDGFVDAGHAGRLLSAHLLEHLDHEVLAEFDHDQLHDYRSRRQAMVFAAHVPHYLAQAAFPEAALRLTRSLNQATGLAVPLAPLEKASASNLADIAEEMAGSTEVQELVATLEQQYDSLQLDESERVPSADEIAAEFERFLAERDKNDEA